MAEIVGQVVLKRGWRCWTMRKPAGLARLVVIDDNSRDARAADPPAMLSQLVANLKISLPAF
jgi:hypothetical protein